jgi:hypothetical protein
MRPEVHTVLRQLADNCHRMALVIPDNSAAAELRQMASEFDEMATGFPGLEIELRISR